MEEEEKKKTTRKRLIRRVSLFKKRKKPEIRPLVRVKKQKNYRKLLTNIGLLVIAIFILVTTLYIVRNVFIPKLSDKKQDLLLPQSSSLPDNNQIKNIIQNTGLEISNINFASNSSVVTFYFKENTYVMLSTKKGIVSQMDLVEAIANQLLSEGKRAIYIDLRYNKPVVKIE